MARSDTQPAVEPTCTQNTIILKLRQAPDSSNSEGKTTKIRVFPKSSFQKAYDVMERRLRSRIELWFDGQLLKRKDTPAIHEIEDGYIVDVKKF